jgi:hypothetical protein
LSQHKKIAEEAQHAFWAKVAEMCPEITSGDFPPESTIEFDRACEKAVEIWLRFNEPEDRFDALCEHKYRKGADCPYCREDQIKRSMK